MSTITKFLIRLGYAIGMAVYGMYIVIQAIVNILIGKNDKKIGI